MNRHGTSIRYSITRSLLRGELVYVRLVTGLGYRAGLLGGQAELLRMCTAVMVSQDLARLSGLVGQGALADLAAHDRESGNGHRVAA